MCSTVRGRWGRLSRTPVLAKLFFYSLLLLVSSGTFCFTTNSFWSTNSCSPVEGKTETLQFQLEPPLYILNSSLSAVQETTNQEDSFKRTESRREVCGLYDSGHGDDRSCESLHFRYRRKRVSSSSCQAQELFLDLVLVSSAPGFTFHSCLQTVPARIQTGNFLTQTHLSHTPNAPTPDRIQTSSLWGFLF